MKVSKFLNGALVACAMAYASTASAFIIEFEDVNVDGGVLEFDGVLGNSLFGRDIALDRIIATDTPDNVGPGNALICDNCVLNFHTGGAQQIGPGQDWEFYSNEDNSSFEITGTAKDMDDNIIADGVLLSGHFQGVQQAIPVGNVAGFFIGGGKDVKDLGIVEYFGLALDTAFRFANTQITFGPCQIPGPGAFSCNVAEADVINSDVPVPAPLALLGLGLLALGARRRR